MDVCSQNLHDDAGNKGMMKKEDGKEDGKEDVVNLEMPDESFPNLSCSYSIRTTNFRGEIYVAISRDEWTWRQRETAGRLAVVIIWWTATTE